MYQAKHFGKRRWVRYRSGIEQTLRRRSAIAQHLYLAQANQELSLHYQPIWDFTGDDPAERGKIVSFEALLRWHNTELGWVPPNELVKVAEEIGIIASIECWVARRALSDLAKLRQYTRSAVSIAINISAIHLMEPSSHSPAYRGARYVGDY